MSGRLHKARTRLTGVRESLVACKELLHYKRDELKKLWLDGVEQKHVLQLLQQVQSIKELPEKISGQLARKEFLIATRGITESLNLLSGTLKDVEALAEVRTELETRQAQLYTRLLEDLTGQLYEVCGQGRLSSIFNTFLRDIYRNNYTHITGSYLGCPAAAKSRQHQGKSVPARWKRSHVVREEKSLLEPSGEWRQCLQKPERWFR